MTSVPGARAPTAASVAAIASAVRYMVTPSQLTRAGAELSKPAAARWPASAPAARSAGTNVTLSGTVTRAEVSALRFQSWVAG
jgi:hypothetical protein